MSRLVRAAGLRWPVEKCFELGKDHLGLDQCQARTLHHPQPPDHAIDWFTWRRRHQTRTCWHHQLARLNREYALVN